ncbi:MAG: hypothetical protein P1P86_03910 [Bacteroidales bacterium]|nr:hypothetical protein [Bacteroidales bacterium]
MQLRILIPATCALCLMRLPVMAQPADTLFQLSAVIYDESFLPVPASHVINMNSHKGDVTDSLGIFSLPVRLSDTLLIRNIAFRDTLVPVAEMQANRNVRLNRRLYQLQEARIFEWGASYEDFREAFLDMPMKQSLGASLGLPRQDPDKVPLEMDEEAVKSAGLLLTSPVSFIYYNFNKHARSARKVYWLKKNRENQAQFDAIVSGENLSELTGLSGLKLQQFILFLSRRMVCDLNSSEFEIYQEIHGLWKIFREQDEKGMLEEAREIKIREM